METKIGIITVAVNCLEYSKQTIDSIKTKHPYEIIFIDNGSIDGTKEYLDSRKDIISYKDPQVSSLAACWNMGIKRAIADGCSHFLVLNNDLILSPNLIDNLVRKMDTGRYVMATGVNEQEGLEKPQDMLEKYVEYDENETDRQHPDFSCFMINKRTIDRIGYFDENFMVAYFEDGDFHARIALAGEIAVSTISAIYYHFASKTVQENDYLKPIVREAFIGNKAYFIKKWGIEPVGDVPKMLEVYYKTPFNDPSRDLKDTSPYFDIND
jgi:GT2 family glycosyltransferase